MTVEELIAKLSEFPKESRVIAACSFTDGDGEPLELEIYVEGDTGFVVFSEAR